MSRKDAQNEHNFHFKKTTYRFGNGREGVWAIEELKLRPFLSHRRQGKRKQRCQIIWPRNGRNDLEAFQSLPQTPTPQKELGLTELVSKKH